MFTQHPPWSLAWSWTQSLLVDFLKSGHSKESISKRVKSPLSGAFILVSEIDKQTSTECRTWLEVLSTPVKHKTRKGVWRHCFR